jgi:integrase
MTMNFDPKVFNGRRQRYTKVLNSQGIRFVWDWSDEKRQYLRRESGLRYSAFKTINGKQISKCFESLQDAKHWRRSAQLFGVETTSQGMLFNEVVERFFIHNQGRWKITTLELYESYLRHFGFFASLHMKQINFYAVDEWLKRIKSKEYLAAQHDTRISYKKELTLLKQIFKYYSEYLDESFVIPCKSRHSKDCIVNHQKFKEAQNRAIEKYMPPEEISRFLREMHNSAEQKAAHWLHYYLAVFMLLTGCRVGEVCALNWEDINLQEGFVMITKTTQWARTKKRETVIDQSTKTHKGRRVEIPPVLVEALRAWGARLQRSTGLVFSWNPVEVMSYRSIQDRFNRTFRKIGSTFSSTHIMRHSFATLWLTQTKGGIQSLQKQLGHSSPTQSMHYAKITEELIRNDLKGFESGVVAKVIPFPMKKGENEGERLCEPVSGVGSP